MKISQYPHRLVNRRYYNLYGLDVYDEYPRYNHIKIHSEDEETTSFSSSKGVFEYIVIPLGLKTWRKKRSLGTPPSDVRQTQGNSTRYEHT